MRAAADLTRHTAQAVRATAQTAAVTAKAAARSAVAAAKAVIAAAQALLSALAAGGGVVLALVVVVCLVGILIVSPFGIFFADGGNAPDAVSPSAAVAQLNRELADRLEELQSGGVYDGVEVHGQPPGWPEVLAVFAARTAGAADGVDVAVLDPERVDRLRTVFWDMTKITTQVETIEHTGTREDGGWTESILHITITPRTPDDMRVFYQFTDDQNEALDELLENRDLLAALAGDLTISDPDAKALLAALPEELSPERRAVVETACSLVGKVNYFWGGKSLVFGWDERWGTIQKVTAAGSSTTGTYRPYGMDCSGFVDWVFYNVTGGEYIIGHGGGATMRGWTESILHITITPRTPDDMRVFYQFTDDQNEALDELLENRDLLAALAGDLTISDPDAKALLAALPEELSPERRAVVETACSLVGKVNYFWGGKSLVFGWDERWGTIQKVTAAGSSTTGTYRPYGMDCSGFVDWVFYNVTGGEYIIGHGGGATMQHNYCTEISWDEALPGDLVFYPGDEHVGIVGGRDENGELLIVHCAFSQDNVVITEKSGFVSIARPNYYSE